MRPHRLLAAALTFAVVALSGSPATAEPVCQRWDLDVTCAVKPNRVTIGDPFTATVTVKNTGDVPLANVTIQLRGDLGAHVPAGQPSPVSTVIPRLEPGDTKELSGTFVCDTGGVCRVLGGARDLIGWAAANGACTVEVVGLPAIGSSMTDQDLKGADKGVFLVGEENQYLLEVKNDGGSSVTPDLRVVFSLPKELEFVGGEAGRDVKVTGQGQTAETTAFALAPDETLKIVIRVKAIAVPPSNLIQTRAVIQTAGGIPVADEAESTTIK